jgi:hypothetical protein
MSIGKAISRAFTPPNSSPGDRGLLAPPPAAPAQESAETVAARRREIQSGQRARGLAATRVTGGQGLTEAPTLARKRLFGE